MHVHEHRVNLVSGLKDYDRLNHGRVSRPQFESALFRCGILLDEREMDVLTGYYASVEEKVAYKLFCADVDSVFDDEVLAEIECKRVCLLLYHIV